MQFDAASPHRRIAASYAVQFLTAFGRKARQQCAEVRYCGV